MKTTRKIAAIAALIGVTVLAGCTTEKVVDNTVDASLFATRTVVKGTVGAGKLAVKGTSAAVKKATGN